MGFNVRYVVNDDQTVSEIHKIVVYKFNISDFLNAEVWDQKKIQEWKSSDSGKFILENCLGEITFCKQENVVQMTHDCILIAEIEKKKLSEFYLRFGKNGHN